MIHLDRPEMLLLFPPAAALVLLLAARSRAGPVSRLRAVSSAILRLSILALLALVLAGPYRPFVTERPVGTLLLADRSGSISDAGGGEIDALRAALGAEGPVEEIPFGDADRSDARPALLRAALRPRGRAHLVTDGHLAPGAAPVLADLAGLGRPVSAGGIRAEEGEADLETLAAPRIRLPAPPRAGEEATVRVSAPGAATVRLRVDGEPAGEAPVADGVAVLPGLHLPAGRHRLTAVSERDGARAAASIETEVEAPLSVLVLGAGGDDPVPAALRTQGLAVRTADRPGDLDRGTVVLALPGFVLPDDGAPLLRHVRGGGGLLVASGPPPGLARYRDRPVADLLPAVPLVPEPEPAPPPPEPPPPDEPGDGATPAEVEKEAATLTLLIVMDRSGSMRGGKIAMARAACWEAANALSPEDRFGVLAFNDEPEWVLPIAPARDLSRLRSALLEMQPGGGTEIFPAMSEAARAMEGETSSVRHVILVSDGQDSLAGFHKLISSMREARITVSAVGIGHDYQPRFLGPIARWGAGVFHDATDPSELPRVVTLDARRVIDAARPPDRKQAEDATAGPPAPEPTPPAAEPERPPEPPPAEPVRVRAPVPLPLTEGLAFPPLPEISPAEPRFPAQVVLAAADGSPVLLLWRYGRGRVALFTGDPTDWAAWPDLPRFLAQLARALAGRGEDRGEAPGIEVASDRVRVRAEDRPAATVEGAGGERSVPLERTAPGVYEGVLPPAPPGDLRTVRARVGDGAEAAAVAVEPPAAEDRDRGTDADRIASLAAAAGTVPGRITPAPEPERRPGKEPADLPLLLAALLLVPVDVAVRRLAR